MRRAPGSMFEDGFGSTGSFSSSTGEPAANIEPCPGMCSSVIRNLRAA